MADLIAIASENEARVENDANGKVRFDQSFNATAAALDDALKSNPAG